MSSKFIDNTAIIQVVGNVFKNPKLLDDTDKYSITEDDFPDRFHKIVFGAIYKIYELGANKITLENISDFLSSRPKSEAVYKKEKGEEWLLNVAEMSQPESFDYYYSRLKKFTLLRAYDNCGVNVSDIYDPDNILDIKKKQQQEDLLDNSSLEDLANKVENKISQIRMDYVDDTIGEAAQAGENISELIDKFKKYPEVGIPLFGPLVNTVTRGARLKKFYLRSAPTGCGKRVADYTPIPTPNGWKTVGEIQVGDYIFGKNGKPTKVLKLYKNSEKIWKITFSDGRSIDCCGEHLWQYSYKTHRGWISRVENTQTIYQRAQQLKNNFKDSDNRGWRFRIPLNEPVEYSEKVYKISPYVMGSAIGDGSFREPDAISSSANEELLAYVLKNYLLGSIEQRYELLAGLLDTNGTISNTDGRISYTTVSKQLTDDVCELCHSLGMITGITLDHHKEYTKSNDVTYVVHILCKDKIKPRLFKLSSKKQKALEYVSNKKQKEYEEEHLAIVNIEPTETVVSMTCFTVDAEDALFQVGDYIVTHNTRTMIADACYVSCGMYYDDTFGWIKTGYKEPSLYITTEQELEEAQTMMLAFISGVNEEKILNGDYSEDEEERVIKAGKILKQAPLYIEELPDFSLKDVENVIKKNIREHDINYLFYDYIHTSLKILEEISKRSGGVKLREDNILFMLSTRLKDLCNKYGIFILSSTQLNGSYVESENPDQNLLRGSKAIADKIDIGELILPVKDKDIEALDSILSSGTFDKPTLKLSFYKNRRGRYKNVILWCKSDLGCCRVIPMFCTTYDYELININDLKINIVNEEESAF